jgi:protein O-GlcNAc transferase
MAGDHPGMEPSQQPDEPDRSDMEALVALFDQGRYAEAATLAQASTAKFPLHGFGWKVLGAALKQMGSGVDALPPMLRAAALFPDDVEAHANLGRLFGELGRLEEAAAAWLRVVAIHPHFAEAHRSLGNILRGLGRLREAEGSYRKAVEIEPGDTPTYVELGNTLRELGRPQDAEAIYRKALELAPHFAEAHNNLGSALYDAGRVDEAEASYRRALQVRPDFAVAHCNLAVLLQGAGRLEEAEASCRRALEIEPELSYAHNALGNILKELALLEQAEASYRRALALKPDYTEAHGNVIFVMDLRERCTIAQQQAERRKWYDAHARRFADSIRPHDNLPEPRRRIRVGYVSADFSRRSPYYAFGPVIALHDRAALDVVCYSGVKHEDEATQRLQRAASAWCSTLGMSDEALAQRIRDDRIDILVDLTGHMSGCRLMAFARKPAPVQVTAWGYANGTGLETMDYLFADPVVLPREDRKHFAEEVVDLPCLLCYEAPRDLPPVASLPALSGEPFTFGCINRIEKVSNGALALWGRILSALPRTRLLMKGWPLHNARARAQLLERLAGHGVSGERVTLLGPSSHAEHLNVYHKVDLVLDPFPHGGGISTAEALAMGAPVVTLYGGTIPGRVSASILRAIDLNEWVARSGDDYVRIALDAARDLPRLARVRAELRARMAHSIIGNVQRYTSAVEAAYRLIWRRWCGRSRASSHMR